MSVLEVVDLAAAHVRQGSETPFGDVARAHPDAPVDWARRALDARPHLDAKVKGGAYLEALEDLAAELRAAGAR